MKLYVECRDAYLTYVESMWIRSGKVALASGARGTQGISPLKLSVLRNPHKGGGRVTRNVVVLRCRPAAEKRVLQHQSHLNWAYRMHQSALRRLVRAAEVLLRLRGRLPPFALCEDMRVPDGLAYRSCDL